MTSQLFYIVVRLPSLYNGNLYIQKRYRYSYWNSPVACNCSLQFDCPCITNAHLELIGTYKGVTSWILVVCLAYSIDCSTVPTYTAWCFTENRFVMVQNLSSLTQKLTLWGSNPWSLVYSLCALFIDFICAGLSTISADGKTNTKCELIIILHIQC